MTEVSPLNAGTRRALLDAIDALADQADALILVGAQAIFLHTGDVDEAIATETKDADLSIDPAVLHSTPLLEDAMRRAGFHLDLENPQPGAWISQNGYPVDLLLAEAVSGRRGSGRSGRIPPHDNMATRRVRGIEGALVDHAPREVAALTEDDDRSATINVAGPAALLVAKLHKVSDRLTGGTRSRPRDAHDVFRLLREVELARFADGVERLRRDDRSAQVTIEAIGLLDALFASPGRRGAREAADAVRPIAQDADLIAEQCAVLAGRLVTALR